MKVVHKHLLYTFILVICVLLMTVNQYKFLVKSHDKLPCSNVSSILLGQTSVNYEALNYMSESVLRKIKKGGFYEPEECVPGIYTAVIIPFRDRMLHLYHFLNHYHPILQRQRIAYKIYVIAQMGEEKFNRGKLMNIGFVEAKNIRNWDCYIFHDVDLFLENDELIYKCQENPIQFSSAIEGFGYKRAYPNNFGGVSAMTKEQMEKVNGFPNSYWGWGGEDDDMAKRLLSSGYRVDAAPEWLGRYSNHKHPQAESSDNAPEMVETWYTRWKNDGLVSLHYTKLSYQEFELYTQINVKITEA